MVSHRTAVDKVISDIKEYISSRLMGASLDVYLDALEGLRDDIDILIEGAKDDIRRRDEEE